MKGIKGELLNGEKIGKSRDLRFVVWIGNFYPVCRHKEVTQINNGEYITTYTPIFEYIISILRIGVIGMFFGIFIGWKGYEKNINHNKKNPITFYSFLLRFLFQ
ncbi:hypothetical protein [Bacillus massilinigeriensis]|uniref:hypothetical protein n=1 Tax=Bacillus massilionigeriensis TaxID=1805475 RepID=UPI001356665A|nr:hypothetical protein [Bacillus massilionigeriensis]